MNKRFWLGAGILAGTIVGAGIFSLPYIVSQIGLLTGFFYLTAFAGVYFAVYIMYSSLVEATQGEHRFFYLAEKFLSSLFSKIASFAVMGGMILALVVYLVLAPTFGALIFNVSPVILFWGFWLLGSIFIFVRLSFQGAAEVLGILGIIAAVLIVFFAGGSRPVEVPSFLPLNLTTIFLPFGPLLFAYAARAAVPRVISEWRQGKKEGNPFSLKKALLLGTFVPAFVYLVFIIGVLRLNPNVSPEALNSLNLSPEFLIVLGVLGLLTIWTSYFIIGSDIREIFKYDFKSKDSFAAAVVLILPPFLYFAGLRNFLAAVGIAGGIFLALEGIFIVAMWRRAFPENPLRPASFLLYLVFLAALVYQIAGFVL